MAVAETSGVMCSAAIVRSGGFLPFDTCSN
jgi:hypothetical protein